MRPYCVSGNALANRIWRDPEKRKQMNYWRTVISVLLPGVLALGQTRIDLSKQSKTVDFSQASFTKPAKTGNSLPSTCSQGEVFFSLASSVAAGQNLFLCTSSNVWTQLTSGSGGSGGSGGGGGTAITSTSSLTDLLVTYSQNSPTILTIAGNCTTAAPCNVRFGANTYALASSATLSVSSGAAVGGMVYIYLTSGPTINVYTTVSAAVTCNSSGVACSVSSGTQALQFPSDSVPLATWTASAGQWDALGGNDLRAFISNRSEIANGVGILKTETAGRITLSADTSVVGVRVAPPANATADCQPGNYAVDGGFFYQCLAINTWLRVALATW